MKQKRVFDNSKYRYSDGSVLPSDQGYYSHISTRYKNYEHRSSEKTVPELYKHKSECCGCTACSAICPVKAITMEPDEEGFLYPVIDLSLCKYCYACERVCVFK